MLDPTLDWLAQAGGVSSQVLRDHAGQAEDPRYRALCERYAVDHSRRTLHGALLDAQLLADVWGADFTAHTHYLRLYMGQLRAKLEREPAEPSLLLTEPGVGYRLAEPHDDA